MTINPSKPFTSLPQSYASTSSCSRSHWDGVYIRISPITASSRRQVCSHRKCHCNGLMLRLVINSCQHSSLLAAAMWNSPVAYCQVYDLTRSLGVTLLWDSQASIWWRWYLHRTISTSARAYGASSPSKTNPITVARLEIYATNE